MALEVVLKLEAQIRELERELHSELPKEIQRARELGDLSENAEYAAAKERQDIVGARIAQLRKRVADLAMIDVSKIPHGVVGLGSKIVVYDVNQDREFEYNLVTTEEADVPAGKISTTSPIGRSLMGKQEGDQTQVRTPGGVRELEIISLKTIHDQA